MGGERTNLKAGLITAITLLGFCAIAGGKVIYVDAGRPSSSGDGQSWGLAYKYLQDALTAAASGDEIWVAEGIYKPDQGGGKMPGDREATFQLKNGVAIYGGFPSGGGAWETRNPQDNATTLSGDLSGNDIVVAEPSGLLDEPTRAENSYHIVTGYNIGETAVLDGFTITAGNANNYPGTTFGAGMFNHWNSNPTVTNCTFSGNSANYGGGMENYDHCNPTINNCTFSGNFADSYGGGMYNYESNPAVTNCAFNGNTVFSGPASGGGMCNFLSSPILTNCTFSGNLVDDFGGGIFNNASSNPVVTGCIFSRNTADDGGGICNINGSSPTIKNCAFSGNSARYSGGGMYNYGSSPVLTDCTFSGNSADSYGGGMHNSEDSDPTVTNCILWGNTATEGGEISLFGSSTVNVNYCDVKDGQAGVYVEDGSTLNWPVVGNITDDPLFVDAANNDLRLWAGSPCIDAADGDAAPATDIDGHGRFDDPGKTNTGTGSPAYADIGAYEWCPPPPAIYVDAGAAPGGDGLSWATAYKYLQDALWIVRPGGGSCEILVAQGIYKPDQGTGQTPGNRAAAFQLVSGVAIYGGFPSGGGTWENRKPQDYTTTLSGDLNGDDGPDFANHAENSYNVVHAKDVDSTAILDGFTIIGGNANKLVFLPVNYWGGGMRNDNSNPTVANCTFSGNSAAYGGGLYNGNSSPTVTNCTFSGNKAGNGAGMCNVGSSPTVTNCVFSGNSTGLGGGGMDNLSSNPVITNCTFSGNTAAAGGGMHNTASNSAVTNCTFSGNSAEEHGGGMDNSNSSSMVTNCTFSGNSAGEYGGGMFSYANSSPTLTNCILWGNTASQGNEIALLESSTTNVNYCDVKGGQTDVYVESGSTLNWGAGNIPDDPMFVGADNLRLQAGSPCIDTGDNEAVPIGITTDLDGNRRIVNGDGDIEYDIINVPAGEYTASGLDKLLLHFNGADGATSTTDDSPSGHPITFQGNAQLDTAEKKWGSASLLLDGSGGYLTIPDSPDWDILASNADDWTIDFWVRQNNPGEEQYYLNQNLGVRWGMYYDGGLGFYGGSSGINLYGGVISNNEWHWIAFCKVADKYAMYADGQQVNYKKSSNTGNYDGTLYIGYYGFGGHIDELRITHGNFFGANPSEKGISATVDMGAYELWDSDGDGIEEGIDTQPTVYSNNFIDAATTSGTITNRGDQILTITDEPDPEGVGIKADAAGGPTPASVSVCGGAEIYTLDAGDEAVVTCGSVEIEVISGIIEITLVPIAGPAATTSLSAGNSMTFEEDTFTVTAPSTNPDIVVIIIDGEEFTLAPGESLTFNQPPVANAGADQTVYAWINGMAEVTLDGSDSNDPDGDELTYYWSWVIDGNTYEANGVNPVIELPVGEHTIELIVNDGLVDSEADYVDVNVIAPLKGKLEITPCVINRDGHKCHKPDNILAFIRLPEGITRGDIDNDEPLTLYPGGVEASRQWIIPGGFGKHKKQLVGISAFFDKDVVLDAVQDNGRVELQVVGQLKSGRYFFGSDTIWIIDRHWWPWWKWPWCGW